MAIDDALFHGVQAGGAPVIRFYQWSPACLSFGRNQAARTVYDAAKIAAGGADVVRRSTGGLAVLHNSEITYSVACPADLLGGPRATYVAINYSLIAALQLLGVTATVAGDASVATRPDSVHPCFHEPGVGEVVVDGGKLVGSAQRSEARTLLQHGSILLDGSQSDMLRWQTSPAPPSDEGITRAGITRAGITLREILGAVPDTGAIVRALTAGFESALGTRLAPGTLRNAERMEANRLEEHYDSHAWTWRR